MSGMGYGSLLTRVATGKGQGGDTSTDYENKILGKQEDFEKAASRHQNAWKTAEQAPERKKEYATLVSNFYNLVTDFYESGWGQSFHFATRYEGETFKEGIKRHEHYIGSAVGGKPGKHLLDLGMGVGGPMREIAQYTGSRVTGVTINAYQVERANRLNAQAKLSHLCEAKVMDFCKLNYKDNSFDGIFAIESTCHAPDRKAVYAEAFRVLKPGQCFASYEWVTTDKYNPDDAEHRKIKLMIEDGNALPDIIGYKQALKDFETCGFEIVEAFDVNEKAKKCNQQEWWEEFVPSWSLETFPHTKLGIFLTNMLTWTLETMRIAPSGTHKTHQILLKARDGLLAGGEKGIFTTMYLVVGRKPLKSK